MLFGSWLELIEPNFGTVRVLIPSDSEGMSMLLIGACCCGIWEIIWDLTIGVTKSDNLIGELPLGGLRVPFAGSYLAKGAVKISHAFAIRLVSVIQFIHKAMKTFLV